MSRPPHRQRRQLVTDTALWEQQRNAASAVAFGLSTDYCFLGRSVLGCDNDMVLALTVEFPAAENIVALQLSSKSLLDRVLVLDKRLSILLNGAAAADKQA